MNLTLEGAGRGKNAEIKTGGNRRSNWINFGDKVIGKLIEGEKNSNEV